MPVRLSKYLFIVCGRYGLGFLQQTCATGKEQTETISLSDTQTPVAVVESFNRSNQVVHHSAHPQPLTLSELLEVEVPLLEL